MELREVVPWGRSLAEYTSMFDLSEADLKKRILGCGDGPASFNSEMTAAGLEVVSCDPIYTFTAQEITRRVTETYEIILAQTKQNVNHYVWTRFKDIDELGRARLGMMQTFLQDFPAGLTAGRYVPAALPSLPFAERQFGLCLCSHLLFLYSAQLSLDFHLSSIQELMRVASEVRIFPLLTLGGEPSPYLEPVQKFFWAQGYKVDILNIPYEFQRGSNQMMVLQR